jgi:hypothetical protein
VLFLIGHEHVIRSFTPHISLARCEPGVDTDYVDTFLATGNDLFERGVIDTVELFATTMVNAGPFYRLVASFVHEVKLGWTRSWSWACESAGRETTTRPNLGPDQERMKPCKAPGRQRVRAQAQRHLEFVRGAGHFSEKGLHRIA